MDPTLSFYKHCTYVSDRIDKRKNLLKALMGSSWGQEKETLPLTYNALGESFASDLSLKKIHTMQNAALRTVTVAHKMAIIDHLHRESLTLSWHHNSRPRPMKETPLQTSLNCSS